MKRYRPLRLRPGIRALAVLLLLGGGLFIPLPHSTPLSSDCLAQPTTPVLASAPVFATVKVAVGNLRANPDLKALVIDKLRRGNRLRLIEQRPPWYLVELADARRGWAHASLLDLARATPARPEMQTAGAKALSTTVATTVTVPQLTWYTVAVTTARIRKEPSRQTDILFRLQKGALVRVKGLQQDWFLIEDATGRSGWGHQRLFSPADKVKPGKPLAVTTIKAVRHLIVSKQTEKVLFELSGFLVPRTFTMAGERPRLVCDFDYADLEPQVTRQVPVSGTLIKGIRIAPHQRPTPKIRVVLDLRPERAYEIEQIFSRKESQFILILNSSKEG
jgi:SH3-like domain-containing protein